MGTTDPTRDRLAALRRRLTREQDVSLDVLIALTGVVADLATAVAALVPASATTTTAAPTTEAIGAIKRPTV